MRVERSLVLEVERNEAPVGRSITVRVRDRSNRPVEGARVTVGSTRVRTDSNGLCTVTVRSPGFWKIVANKSPTDRVAYRPTTGLLRVMPRSVHGRSTP